MRTSPLALALLAVASHTLAQTSPPPANDAKPLAFEVVTIKPDTISRGWRLQPTPDGYTGMNISLYKLVQEAYGIFDSDFLTGGPSWIDTDKFDLEAKFDPADIPNAKDLTYRQRADMLRAVLADRFQLKVHFQKKEFPVYLVVANGGPKLKETQPSELAENDTGMCGQRLDSSGQRVHVGCTLSTVTDLLHRLTGRNIIDKTGLTSRYDYSLHATAANASVETADPSAPSVFTAVQEQLGLKLEPSTAPLDVLVIDSAQKPTPN